jgi:hypothetical protein
MGGYRLELGDNDAKAVLDVLSLAVRPLLSKPGAQVAV